jgi:hypothetical protein
MLATTAYQRARSCAQTMGLRWLCVAYGDFYAKKAAEKGCTTSVNSDDYLRMDAADRPAIVGLAELGETMRVLLNGAKVNGFVMAFWTHFGKPLTKAASEQGEKDWIAFDEAAAQLVISDEDVVNPSDMVERLGMSRAVAEHLGVRSMLLKCCPSSAPPSAPARSNGGAWERNSGSGRSTAGDSESKASGSTRLTTSSWTTTPTRPRMSNKGPSQLERSARRGVATPPKTVKMAIGTAST